ncbi:hypothetical protein FCH28_18810 [Streptomyces piniterrae]|uniref:LPXTG cell wall anchor domain-containing protein n=1 Tax=Streptomyces piniterrae TaxID=2571125 RepID=A0A4U0NP80_9ACTN|nr:hypothetical protein [Streptomyces piniterrae]TJZ51914.1 hypothetical protein FCH28_18810 [Streptomyces piniterrae]
MRLVSRTLAGAALTAMAFGVATPSASADPSASVSPSAISPGGTVTVTVMCESQQAGKLPAGITANGQVLAQGSIPLKRQGQTSTYRGSGRVAGKLSGGPDKAGKKAGWAIDGQCPGGKHWSATVRTQDKEQRSKEQLSGAGQESGTGKESGAGQQGDMGQPSKAPHGKMRTGYGGSSERSNTAMIAAGGAALAVAACGGYLLMRRRSREED